jgi:hypothetical protein
VRLRADQGRFPSETIDGETVLIDADRGHLFLLTGLGPWLWSRFAESVARDIVLGEVESAFGGDAAAECGTFIDSMRELDLLVESDQTAGSGSPPPLPAVWAPPSLETFEDVSEIIQMDPIHEADPDTGWPHADRS